MMIGQSIRRHKIFERFHHACKTSIPVAKRPLGVTHRMGERPGAVGHTISHYSAVWYRIRESRRKAESQFRSTECRKAAKAGNSVEAKSLFSFNLFLWQPEGGNCCANL
jgi:hypothetical protein